MSKYDKKLRDFLVEVLVLADMAPDRDAFLRGVISGCNSRIRAMKSVDEYLDKLKEAASGD